MEKETILAKIRVTMHFSEATLGWMKQIQNSNIWFAQKEGSSFFAEYRGTWERLLINTSEPIINDYFTNLGLSQNQLPRIKVYESYRGSWIMEAAITMFASVGTSYALLKGVSDLPKIADGLNELKSRLKDAFSRKASKEVSKELESAAKKYELPPPPSKPLSTDFVIDARPLLTIKPSLMKSHKIHLNIGISRDGLTLENLGQDIMRDIRIGIFKNPSQRNQWNYADSYMGTIDILSSHQTITKNLSEFRDSNGLSLDLSERSPIHVDCWVQDTYGIYLFMFYLEEE